MDRESLRQTEMKIFEKIKKNRNFKSKQSSKSRQKRQKKFRESYHHLTLYQLNSFILYFGSKIEILEFRNSCRNLAAKGEIVS